MDFLNNLNVIIGIIVGIFGIGGYLFGIIAYLRNKAASSQRKQTANVLVSQPSPSSAAMSKPLSKLDWMEVLWAGLEDCVRAREGGGIFGSIATGFFGALIFGAITLRDPSIASYTALALFIILFLTANLLFYIYFVGRRIEKKVESLSQQSFRKSPQPKQFSRGKP